MSKSTISTFELFDLFPDSESARLYLENRLWPDGPKCLTCKSGERITIRTGNRIGYYLCGKCNLEFTIRTGTIFERSHVPLQKWLYAMYLLVTARKGISSMQLAKEIGITQKSAWFVLHRLREACSKDMTRLRMWSGIGPVLQTQDACRYCKGGLSIAPSPWHSTGLAERLNHEGVAGGNA